MNRTYEKKEKKKKRIFQVLSVPQLLFHQFTQVSLKSYPLLYGRIHE